MKNVLDMKGVHWNENGQVSLSDAPLRLYQKLDRLFLSWAKEMNAREYSFPLLISAHELQKLDYYKSFPHLVTFPVALKNDSENLKRYTEGERISESGEIVLTETQAIKEVLTPAACYHFYIQFQGQKFSSPQFLTTRCTCNRRESFYEPLRRQWNFSMREIVAIGDDMQVKDFLSQWKEKISKWIRTIQIEAKWMDATDPFFNPLENPKFIWQKIEPIKQELTFGGDLAIASINFHKEFFGQTFQLSTASGVASSGCVAFGLERWIFAFIQTYGFDESKWPSWEDYA